MIDAEMRQRIKNSYHEAGHAVESLLLGHRPRYVRIETHAMDGGEMQDAGDLSDMDYLRILFAGRLAEIHWTGDATGQNEGPEGDITKACNVAERMWGRWSAGARERAFEVQEAVMRDLRMHRDEVRAVAQALMSNGELSGDQAAFIVRGVR